MRSPIFALRPSRFLPLSRLLARQCLTACPLRHQSRRCSRPQLFRTSDTPGIRHRRLQLKPGNSTPCVFGNSIFLTTWDAETKELATVSVSSTDGRTLWKQVAPAKDIERFHATGSPATCSVACDGERVFAFFGSYGMLCYGLNGERHLERSTASVDANPSANGSRT